jgi:hypothetical protein
VILIGTSMGGSLQTASAAGNPFDKLQKQIDVLNTKVQDNSLLVVHTRAGNYTFPQGTNDLVPLDDLVAGDPPITQSNQFNAAGDFTVTYTAECAVAAAAGNTTTWLNVSIELVNVVTNEVVTLTPTTGTSEALCTSNGTAGADGWAMNSITGVAKNVPRANYAVQIKANIQNGVAGTSGWLGDTSLVIRK